jgi:hypothetical protein
VKGLVDELNEIDSVVQGQKGEWARLRVMMTDKQEQADENTDQEI